MENNKIKVKVLISYDVKGQKTAKEYADIYKELFEVVLDDKAGDFDLSYDKAVKENMTHSLHFLDDEKLLLSAIGGEMEYTLEITVDDLKKVLSQNA